MMTFEEFVQLKTCPANLPPALKALWHDRQGNWNAAHDIVQNANDDASNWVHAYLHRKEGDLSNARYWYKRSHQPEFQAGLAQEWEHVARDLLQTLEA